jgi:hypothetical protein
MFQIPRLKRSRRQHCDVCADNQLLSGDYVFDREPVCTCGAGPVDEWTLHAPDCDTVPCPFCPLLNDSAVGIMRSREKTKT